MHKVLHDFANYQPSREETLRTVLRNEWLAGRRPHLVRMTVLDMAMLSQELGFRLDLPTTMYCEFGAVALRVDGSLAPGRFIVELPKPRELRSNPARTDESE